MAFKIDLDIEGDNGVGFFLGYYIDSLDSIYLTSLQLPEIYSVNKEGKINKKRAQFSVLFCGRLYQPVKSRSYLLCKSPP